jgi:hypothetical protein
MSVWRRKAIESFPELRPALNDPEEIFSPYALWFHLLPMLREAHRTNNDDLLGRIYGYAEWSSQQEDLSNAVAVSFYEHLFDERWMCPLVVPWLSARIVADVRPLWADRLAPDDLAAVNQLLGG